MPTILKRILISCIVALPSFVFAADNTTEVKPLLPPLAATAVVETAPKPATSPHARIGYVDIVKIGTDSERGKSLKAVLTTSKDKIKGKIDVKKKALEKFKTSIETKIAGMSPQQREAKSKEFQKKLEEFQRFAQAAEEEFFALQDKETRLLYEAIEQAAVIYGKANGFAVIVVKKELLFVDNSVDAQDVTEALVKMLNQADPKK